MDAEQAPRTNIVQRLQRRMTEARRAGFTIRTEWLGGEAGGSCEFGGRRWIFVDLSLPVAEQLAQLDQAIAESSAAAVAARASS